MNIFEAIVENRRRGRRFVLATIVKRHGSSPREVGARMMVFADGSINGTIGGGRFEKLVIDDCRELFTGPEKSLLKSYRFASEGANAIGMQCGGEAEVFMELFESPHRLVIVGAGHIGCEVVDLVRGLDFDVTVVDDRRELLDELDEDVNVVLTDSGYVNKIPEVDDRTFVVIVARSHDCELAVLQQVLDRGCAYVGSIGSRAKIARQKQLLKSHGISQASLDQLHAPIGLDIKAEGPREIAIAIVAELIAVKNHHLGKK